MFCSFVFIVVTLCAAFSTVCETSSDVLVQRGVSALSIRVTVVSLFLQKHISVLFCLHVPYVIRESFSDSSSTFFIVFFQVFIV